MANTSFMFRTQMITSFMAKDYMIKSDKVLNDLLVRLDVCTMNRSYSVAASQ